MAEARRKKADLAQKYQLTDELLQRKVSDDHMLDLQDIISWKDVGPYLAEIERIHIVDIDKEGDNEKDKRRRLINKWEDFNGDDATYDAMIYAMLKAGKKDEATKVCKMLNPGAGPKPAAKFSVSRLDDSPTLITLGEFTLVNGSKINILDKISTKYQNLAIHLLEDGDGSISDQLESDCRGQAADIKRAIIKMWLRGEGKMPVSWRTLVGVLETMKLKILGKQIRDALQ